MKARIMIAQDAKALERTKDALDDFDLVVVTDIKAAQYQIMEDGIDLFVIGVHFDESRAIELVGFIRRDAKHKTTPILLVRLLPTKIADSIKTTIDALIAIRSVDQYLELEGQSDFADRIKEAVMHLLPKQKVQS